MVAVCGRLSGCRRGQLWHVDGWPWLWWLWAVVVLYGRCFVVVVAFVAIGVRGWSFVAVGDHCGWLSPFVLIPMGSLSVVCVVGGGKRKKSHITHDYQTRVICYVSQINNK